MSTRSLLQVVSPWPVIAALLLSSGCWVPIETGDIMRRDLNGVRRDLQQAQKGLDMQRAQLDEQMQQADEQIKKVAQTLQDLNRAARTTDADSGVQLQELRHEVQDLRGTIELVNYRLGKIEALVEGEGSLSERVEKLENALPANHAPTPTPAAAEGAPKEKKALLAYGKQLAKTKKVDEARGVFRDILRKWPDQKGITDEAYFQLGELYWNQKKYRSALQEYIHVVESFASGAIADDAYYRIGMCSEKLGNLEDAKVFYEEIINHHRKSPLLKSARSRLKDVQKRLAREKTKKKGGK